MRQWHSACRCNGVPSAAGTSNSRGKNTMMNLYLMLRNRLAEEEGQDLVEYALIIALIALACVTGLKGLATAIQAAFTNIGTNL